MLLIKAVCTLMLVRVATSNESVKEATRITSYDPGELLAKIFNPNSTISSRQRGYGLIFEDQLTPQTDSDHGQYGLLPQDGQRLKFEDDQNSNPVKFQDDYQNANRPFEGPLVQNQVTFQDSNNIDQGNKKKRRRRRRKPKAGLKNYGAGYQGDPNLQAGSPGFPGPNPYPGNAGIGANYVNPEYPPRPFRRRRPTPSLASDALTAVTGALTSIALYDDYQCVPRLLCEAAGGGSLGSNGVLDSIAGIQPLLTLLSAYNGISGSPLFVFGRAVFLGMTSRGNTGTCRYAYPQCPTDPEQLIYYLNNHNGGFFRFFNAPSNQNLEQFYNYLGQNGFDLGQDFGQNSQYGVEQYGQQGQGNYGLYQNQQGQGYGIQNNHIGNQRPGFGQNYGSNYDYNKYGSNVRFKDSDAKIEKRIQNKPVKNNVDNFDDYDNFEANFQFPEDSHSENDNTGPIEAYDDNEQETSLLKFPEDTQKYGNDGDFTRKGKSILFPENQYNQNAYSNKNYLNIANQNNGAHTQKPYIQHYNRVTTSRPYYQHNYNYEHNYDVNYNNYKRTTEAPFNENDYYYDQKHNFYVKKDQNQANYHNNYDKYQNQNNYNKYQNQNNYENDQNQGNYHNNYYNKYQNQVNYNKDSNKVNYNYYGNSNKDDGTQTVYIVRGNGDPNRPQIVKVRPGQTVG